MTEPDPAFDFQAGPPPPPPARNVGQRWWCARPSVQAVAAGLTLALLAGGFWAYRALDSDGGLPRVSPTTGYELYPYKTGKEFSLGSLYIEKPEGDVQILAVKPLTSANVEYLGAYTIWPRDTVRASSSGGDDFPAPFQEGYERQLNAVIPHEEFAKPAFPGEDGGGGKPLYRMSVTAGFRYLGGGDAAVNGVTIRYRDGDEVRTQHYKQAIYACEKGPKQRNDCPEGFSDDETLRKLGLLED